MAFYWIDGNKELVTRVSKSENQKIIADKISEVLNLPIEEVIQTTSRNAIGIFDNW